MKRISIGLDDRDLEKLGVAVTRALLKSKALKALPSVADKAIEFKQWAENDANND